MPDRPLLSRGLLRLIFVLQTDASASVQEELQKDPHAQLFRCAADAGHSVATSAVVPRHSFGELSVVRWVAFESGCPQGGFAVLTFCRPTVSRHSIVADS